MPNGYGRMVLRTTQDKTKAMLEEDEPQGEDEEEVRGWGVDEGSGA